VSILKEAKALIEKGWCSGWFATNKAGRRVDPSDRTAVNFCALGALERLTQNCYTNTGYEYSLHYLSRAANRIVPGANVPEINDCWGKEKTLKMFDLAICMEECDNEASSASQECEASSASQERG